MSRTRINWNIVLKEVKTAIQYFRKENVKPTLRTIFYYLVSKNILPNTSSSYKYLSKKLVEARKMEEISWSDLADRTRYVLGRFDDSYPTDDDLRYVEDRCKDRLEDLDIIEMIKSEFSWIGISGRVGFWAKQPVIPEVWVEKDAIAPTIENWTRDLHVMVRVNRGYSSWTFIYENVQSLRRILKNSDHKKVVVLYIGDLDPSGVDIERFLKEALQFFNLDEHLVELKRIAVTEQQVEEFKLPPRPEDATTLEKLHRDPRMKKYAKKYIVEVDALIAYASQQFRELLRNSILQYHDKNIYNEVKKKAKELAEKSKKIVQEHIKKAIEKVLNQAKELLENPNFEI